VLLLFVQGLPVDLLGLRSRRQYGRRLILSYRVRMIFRGRNPFSDQIQGEPFIVPCIPSIPDRPDRDRDRAGIGRPQRLPEWIVALMVAVAELALLLFGKRSANSSANAGACI